MSNILFKDRVNHVMCSPEEKVLSNVTCQCGQFNQTSNFIVAVCYSTLLIIVVSCQQNNI